MLTEDELDDIIEKSDRLSLFAKNNIDKEVTATLQAEFEIVFKDLSLTLDAISKKYRIGVDFINRLVEERTKNQPEEIQLSLEESDKIILWIKDRIIYLLNYREHSSN